MPQVLTNEPIGEADLTFQIKLSEQIDRFRRILNSGDNHLEISIFHLSFVSLEQIYIFLVPVRD